MSSRHEQSHFLWRWFRTWKSPSNLKDPCISKKVMGWTNCCGACNSGFRLVKSMPGSECIQQHHLMIHLSQNSSGLTKTGKAFFGSADLRLASVLQTTQQKKWHKWEIWFMSPLAHISCSTDEVHKVRFRRTWETPRPLRHVSRYCGIFVDFWNFLYAAIFLFV